MPQKKKAEVFEVNGVACSMTKAKDLGTAYVTVGTIQQLPADHVPTKPAARRGFSGGASARSQRRAGLAGSLKVKRR